MKVCNECKNRRKRITAIRIAGDEPDDMDRVSFCETKRHLYTHRDIYNHMEALFGQLKTVPELVNDSLTELSRQVNEAFKRYNSCRKENNQ